MTKQASLSTLGLFLSALALGSCSGESHPPAQGAKVSGTVPAPVQTPAAAPSQVPAAKASSTPGTAGAETEVEYNSRALDPANARGGAARYQGTAAEKLDPRYDLSKVQPNDAPANPAADDHDHDHDHGAEGDVAELQDGSSLLPEAQAKRFQGRLELVDGVQQVNDLGKLRQGEMSAFDFPFVSKGTDSLVITGVKPSCGCTKAEIVLLADDGTRAPYTKGDPIPVGKRFFLESEISTDGKPGGPFSAQISIYSNDIRGAYNVRLTADIEPVLTVTPSPSVFFGRLTTSQSAEQVLGVSSTRGEPFLLRLGQEVIQEPLKLEFLPKDPDAEGKSSTWEIKVGLGPNSKIGMNSYPLSFKTDIPIAHPKYPSHDGSLQTHGIVVNVQAQVVGMISAEPPFLTFGMVKPQEAVERSLRIESHDDFKIAADTPVLFEGLQGQEFPYSDAFSVTVEPIDGGQTANLKVVLKGMPDSLNGSFGGLLRIQVGHPGMEEVQVRFSGVCRPGLPVTTGQPR